jgi:hypothetical protein
VAGQLFCRQIGDCSPSQPASGYMTVPRHTTRDPCKPLAQFVSREMADNSRVL